MIKAITITDRAQWLAARQKDVTASVAGALLGVHPYCTSYELWTRKTRIAPDPEDIPFVISESGLTVSAMERGKIMEPIAIGLMNEFLAKNRPDCNVASYLRGKYYSDGTMYFRDAAIRLGATPDVLRISSERGLGVIQIKTVNPMIYRAEWVNDFGDVTPPDWIVIQTLVEAHLTGAEWAAVWVMQMNSELTCQWVDVPLHAGIIERVIAETAAFWEMIERGEKPDPDYSRDGDLIKHMYAPSEGEVADLSADNSLPEKLDAREALKLREADGNAAEKARKIIDAELLHRLGGAARARIADGRMIAAKVISRKGFEVKPSSYPQIKVLTQ